MKEVDKMRTTFLTGLFAVASCLAPAWGAIPPHPGLLNYVEGQANIDGRTVTSKSVGTSEVEQGQVIETGAGKAEILLTPGVFMRLGNNSSVRMLNPGLADTSVELLHGQAMVEATSILKANNIEVLNQGSTTKLDKEGLYSFRTEAPQVEVYDGKASVQVGDKRQDLKKGHSLTLATLKTDKFDTKQGDELYRWSDIRSSYLSEASMASARTVVINNNGWGGGWYWNQGFGYYSFLPGDGFFSSPFGWGFYSPVYFRNYGFPHRYDGNRYGAIGYSGRVGVGRPSAAPFAGRSSFGAGPAPRASFARPAAGGGHVAGGGHR